MKRSLVKSNKVWLFSMHRSIELLEIINSGWLEIKNKLLSLKRLKLRNFFGYLWDGKIKFVCHSFLYFYLIKYIHFENKMDSKILKAGLQYQCMNLCEFPKETKWQLKYRVPRDGFKDFHSRSNGVKNTLKVIRTTSGLFGGFLAFKSKCHRSKFIPL